MLGEKPVLLAAYGAIAVALALALPFALRLKLSGEASDQAASSTTERTSSSWQAAMLWLLGATTLWLSSSFLPGRFVLYSALFTVAWHWRDGLLRSERAPVTFMALQLGATLLWWRHPDNDGWLLRGQEVFLMLLLTGCTRWLLNRDTQAVHVNSHAGDRVKWLIFGGFALSAITLSFSTGLVRQWAQGIAWHHWSAYIGPAQLVAQGVVPLKDIPLQYGLGPTLLLSAGCSATDCWSSMYWLSAISCSALVIAVGALAWRLSQSRSAINLGATLLIVLASCLLWTGFPPDLTSVLATPSTFGLRFLPGTLFLLVLIARTGRQSDVPNAPWWGHLTWGACLLWSPESGVHATAIWVPYVLWASCATRNNGWHWRSISVAALKLTLSLSLIVFVATLVYRQIWREWPDPTLFIAYLLPPPGPLPVNPFGTIWFACACLACLVLSLTQEVAKPAAMRSTWLTGLMAVAAFSYYLGRSHDNNVLNLMPYLALTLFAARGLTMRTQGALHTWSTTLLALLIGWIPVMGLQNIKDAYAHGQLIEFAPRTLIATFNRSGHTSLPTTAFREHTGNMVEYRQASTALRTIQTQYGESVEVLEAFPIVDAGTSLPAWSGLHSHANFTFMPSTMRRMFLARVSHRLHRPGWILFHKQFDARRDVEDYDAVYQRDVEREFGDFRAIRYTPRPATLTDSVSTDAQ